MRGYFKGKLWETLCYVVFPEVAYDKNRRCNQQNLPSQWTQETSQEIEAMAQHSWSCLPMWPAKAAKMSPYKDPT
jgi:hypothetical protein